jgi:metallophosphoesterase (TIGR03767 family)
MLTMDRRTFLHRTAAVAATTWASGLWLPGSALARERTLAMATAPEGTTLAASLVPGDGEGWVRFSEGPGWPLEVRAELAEPKRDREDRREALATIVHLTDIHVIDAQSPTRVEFVDRLEDPGTLKPGALSSAHRPQETLCGHVSDAMIRALAAIGVGPVTGRPFDCAVSTGDNTDNQQENEVDWFIALLDGGRPVEINSGDPDRYEGVQDDDPLTYDFSYYHPDPHAVDDDYKRVFGFPDRPGLLDAVIAPFTPVGLPCPWYSVYGNHDGLVQGNMPDIPPLEQISVGPLKVVGLPAGLTPARAERALTEGNPDELYGGALDALADGDLAGAEAALQAPVRLVEADERRRFLSRTEYAAKHREHTGGPGPVGHGLDEEATETGRLYYTFQIADGVLGIALDSVNPGGFATGSLDRAQFAWLEERLIEVHARYYAPDGGEIATDHGDQLVVLFAHHNMFSMDNPFPDLFGAPEEQRVQDDELEQLLHRFPNVVAFVNGHSHVNRVTPFPDPQGRTGGFWEISTAAHIDHPQQSRIVEVVDNADGTLSLLSVIVDHAGPVRSPEEPTDVLGLASFSREMALNDPQVNLGRVGDITDRNVELLIEFPFERRGDEEPGDRRSSRADEAPGRSGQAPGSEPPQGRPVGGADATQAPALPATGGGALVGSGAILLAGALALRRRAEDETDTTSPPDPQPRT